MPTSTRYEKLALLQALLDACHKHKLTYRTTALADRILPLLKPYAFGKATEREYIRIIIDTLNWEEKNGKEFTFAH